MPAAVCKPHTNASFRLDRALRLKARRQAFSPSVGSDAGSAQPEYQSGGGAEQGDAQSVADLVRRFRYRTRRTRSIGRNRTDCRIGHEREGDPVADPPKTTVDTAYQRIPRVAIVARRRIRPTAMKKWHETSA